MSQNRLKKLLIKQTLYDFKENEILTNLMGDTVSRSKEIEPEIVIDDQNFSVIASAAAKVIDQIQTIDITKLNDHQLKLKEMDYINGHIKKLVKKRISKEDFHQRTGDLTCLKDDNENGICDTKEIFGCKDPDAVNYKSDVTTNNGSCVYKVGCMVQTV